MPSRGVDERRCPSVDEFVKAYRRTFEAFDAPTIVDLFSFPLQVTSAPDDVTVTTVPTRDAWFPLDLGEGLRITALAHNETPRLRTRMHAVRSDQPDDPAAHRAC